MMSKKGKRITAAIMAALFMSIQAVPMQTMAAQDYTVTASTSVLYSNSKTVVYAQPDISSAIITSIKAGVPVSVTGVTSNGWFQVSLNGTYYIPGYGLEEKNATVSNDNNSVKLSYTDDEIKKMTKGTFSFYQNTQLRAFTREEVQDMDDNTYIKYLDSFLIGNAMVDYCILQDSGVTLKTEYDKKAATDSQVAAMTMRDYLANYRNDYLNDSMWGPARNEEGLKVILNRAIRYEISSFSTMYKNTVIGEDEVRMEKVLSDLIQTMKEEQGVTFTYKKSYGTYENPDGRSTSGWLVEFTKK